MNRPAAPKRHLADLALLGGIPLFAEARPSGPLTAPNPDVFMGLVRQAWAERRLSNNGPLVVCLEERLAALHGVGHCVAVANAGLGLSMLMQLLAEGRPGDVLMPGFSFRGLPHFAAWAGLTPHFCDVDPSLHTLSVEAAAAAIDQDSRVLLAVGTPHAAGDVEGLVQLADRHDLPLVFDSVYRVCASHGGKPAGGNGVAEVFSLHASKLINGFEGGYITTNDGELARLLRWQRNFCFPSEESAQMESHAYLLGLNAKLNEAHAAMALASLDRLDLTLAGNRERYQAYAQGLAGVHGLALLPYPEQELNHFQMPVLEVMPDFPLSRDTLVAVLRAEGMAIHAHYSPLVADSYPHAKRLGPLPVARALADRFLQLPSGEHVSVADIEAVVELLGFLAESGGALAARLGGRA